MTNNNEQQMGFHFDTSYVGLPEIFYSPMAPNPVKAPQLAVLNETLAQQLGLNVEALKSHNGIEMFAGNRFPEAAQPLAQAYAGHQFGHFTRLGDGRALLIGEHVTPDGKRVDIQLKGSGRTPYSRGGDGRASIGPMLREYIISEAMYALGIPTTRSLAVVSTGENIVRETLLPGAVLTRVAASHLRVGTFQYAGQWGSKDDLEALVDYTLQRHYPNVDPGNNPALILLQLVVERQASLISKWQLVGFIHGVMNTDNMSICGETIDYGPCAFMDTYDEATVFSSIDKQGRYAYGNQPYMAKWNLARLAESLLPVLHEDHEQGIELAEQVLQQFSEQFFAHWLAGMRAKLGLFNGQPQDEKLIKDLLELMSTYEADYTNTFCALTLGGKLECNALFNSDGFKTWQQQWQQRLAMQQQSQQEVQQLMKASNPAIIPRNHFVEQALDAAVNGDYSVMDQLLQALKQPYAYLPEQQMYATPPISEGSYRTFCGT